MQETKDALVRVSDLPLSVLIVGVGTADFTQMEVRSHHNIQSFPVILQDVYLLSRLKLL